MGFFFCTFALLFFFQLKLNVELNSFKYLFFNKTCKAIKSRLLTVLAAPHKFWYFSLSLSFCNFQYDSIFMITYMYMGALAFKCSPWFEFLISLHCGQNVQVCILLRVWVYWNLPYKGQTFVNVFSRAGNKCVISSWRAKFYYIKPSFLFKSLFLKLFSSLGPHFL